jgi:glycosyltransferase involved in cell wall biosynthesis
MRKNICILSFSPVARDARVLRQIKYLSPYYNLTVIGFGKAHPDWAQLPAVTWETLDSANIFSFLSEVKGTGFTAKIMRVCRNPGFYLRNIVAFSKNRLAAWFFLPGGKVLPPLYSLWFWYRSTVLTRALDIAIASNSHLFYANEWDTLPIAVKAAGRNNARVVFDAHEYAPLEYGEIEESLFKTYISPAIYYVIRKYSRFVDASITVAPAIAERYEEEFRLKPVVILNAPQLEDVEQHAVDPRNIRLIHHASAAVSRRLETMIEAMALCDSRYSLHFMLVGDNDYICHLRQLSEELAPGRVFFHSPVSTEDIVTRISEFDMGLHIIEPRSYNYACSLPNKFFEFIAAGLAVCIGPSPEMAKFVRRYGLGCVASSFQPQDVARTLNSLTVEQIEEMRKASKRAARELNADKEMKKVCDLIQHLVR